MTSRDGGAHRGPGPVPRRARAVYAFAGATEELRRTVPLEEGGEVLLHRAMRLRRSGRLPRPVVMRLTTGRLSLLMHRAFGPDEDGDDTVVGLTARTGRAALDTPLRDVDAVAEVLTRWHRSR